MKNVNLFVAMVLSLTLSACDVKNDKTAANADNSAKVKDSFKQNPKCYPHCTAGDILNPQK